MPLYAPVFFTNIFGTIVIMNAPNIVLCVTHGHV
jgi:hypothetical protein